MKFPPIEHRGDLVRYVLALFVAACVAVAAIMLTVVVQSEQTRDQIAADQEDRELAACRAVLTSATADAQTDYLLAFGAALTAFAQGDPTDALLAEVSAAGAALDEARDARVAFEVDPSGDC